MDKGHEGRQRECVIVGIKSHLIVGVAEVDTRVIVWMVLELVSRVTVSRPLALVEVVVSLEDLMVC